MGEGVKVAVSRWMGKGEDEKTNMGLGFKFSSSIV